MGLGQRIREGIQDHGVVGWLGRNFTVPGQIAQQATRNDLNAGRWVRDDLRRRMEQFQTDPLALGYTPEQQRQMTQQAMAGFNAASIGQAAQLGQAALAGGVNQGVLREGINELASGTQDAAVQASSQVAQAQSQRLDAERDRLMADVQAQRDRAQREREYWSQFSLDAAGSVIEGLKAAGVLG